MKIEKLSTPIQKVESLVSLNVQAKELALQLKEVNRQIAINKQSLLEKMQEMDVLTLKTGKYTLSRAVRQTPVIEDYQTLKKSLEEAGLEVLTEEVFAPQMQVMFKQAVKDGRDFDGLGKKETSYISIRENKSAASE